MDQHRRGYTLIELITVIAILALIATTALPQFVKAKDQSRESEAKANLHMLQIAIERYAVDNGEYPRYLLGGDTQGWETWHKKWDDVNNIEMRLNRVASNDKLDDPLIKFRYLDSYPGNPFTDDNRTVLAATNINGSSEPGDGDPRFGFNGGLMGQGLDDMNIFKGAVHPGPFYWSDVETRRTLDHGDWMNVPKSFIDPSTNMYYLFGGRRGFDPESKSKFNFTFWSGNFFYKAAPDVMLRGRGGMTIAVPNTNGVGGFRDRYILGVYGALGTDGLDVIRLEPDAPDGSSINWRLPPPFSDMGFQCGYEDFTGSFFSPGGLPEVFGGGDENTGPWWYYNEGGGTGPFIHGAPDGVPDGVIMVLTESATPYKEVGNSDPYSGGEWNGNENCN
jgi:prepilin-type N-terminal cleavage/methylation domain-containing protein